MAIVGVILFVAWGLKQREDSQKIIMVWALVIGVLGLLLTSQFGFMGLRGGGMMGQGGIGGMMGQGGMGGMMGSGGFDGRMDQKTWKEMMKQFGEKELPQDNATVTTENTTPNQ